MRKTLIMILLAMIWNGISAQNIALTKSKPVRMVRPESGYKLFVKAYVENEIELWQRKDPNESNARYKNRVTETKRQEMIKILEEEAKDKYLQEISKTMVLDLSLKGYDNNDPCIVIYAVGHRNMFIDIGESAVIRSVSHSVSEYIDGCKYIRHTHIHRIEDSFVDICICFSGG